MDAGKVHTHRHRHDRGPLRRLWHTHAHRHARPVKLAGDLWSRTLAGDRHRSAAGAHRHTHRGRRHAT